MTKLTLAPPVTGEKNTVAEPKVGSALTAIELWANGNVDSTNIKAEGVTEAALTAAVRTLINAKIAGLTSSIQAGSFSPKSGEMVLATGAGGGTATLPAATANASLGIFCGSSTTSVKVTGSGGAVIYGDFIVAQPTITLLPNQHVILFAEGTNWLIISGEPKREQTLTEIEKTRTSGTEYEPSASRPSIVTVQVNLGSTGGAIIFFINGTKVGEWAISSGTSLDMPITLPQLNPGDKWNFTTLSGAPQVSSTYRIL